MPARKKYSLNWYIYIVACRRGLNITKILRTVIAITMHACMHGIYTVRHGYTSIYSASIYIVNYIITIIMQSNRLLCQHYAQ